MTSVPTRTEETAAGADNLRVMEQHEPIEPTHTDRPDFRVIRDRFQRLNRARLARISGDLRPLQQEFLQLLPLLFHINHPLLPGYVDKTTPSGVPDYSPDALALSAARRLAKSFELKKRAYRRFEIQALYLMGSPGTIAYSPTSDFDIWVCHDPGLDPGQIEALQLKAQGIEQWARTLDVEAHLFLVNPERFRQGEHSRLTRESSGSMQHYLLLEEFYRTGVLLAGRYPLWWLVPAEHELNYDEYVADIKLKRYIHSKDHIDFGGLAAIRAEEFYGASLWLLYKGINAPYKSILKTLLMEAYASEFPGIDLLCVEFKRQIYQEQDPDIDALDPYRMMLHKVEAYLSTQESPQRLDLARRSFYFKVNEKLSDPDAVGTPWRREQLTRLVEQWGWPHGKVLRLDRRDEWKLDSVMDERKQIIREFTTTYRFLSEFTRQQGNTTNLIRADDVHILGRKLYAAFERKAGKIEIMYRGITPDMYASHLSFHRLFSEEGDEYWMVFNGVVPASELAVTRPLRRAYSLLELIAWCYFNRILHANTLMGIYTDDTDLTEKELQQVVERLCRLFTDDVLKESSIHELRQPARIAAIGTFVNVGLDPFSSRTRQGRHLTSNRTDALKYGGLFENLALSIDQVIVNSWQEVMTYRYLGVAGLMKCLQDYIKWSPPGSGRPPPSINAFSFSSYRGSAIARRIENLFAGILRCFYGTGDAEYIEYILGIESAYYVLRIEHDTLQYHKVGDMKALFRYLGNPQAHFRRLMFDDESLAENVLPLIYQNNRPGMVQCFYEVRGEQVAVYILDERGSLTMQNKPFYDVVGLIRHYQEFFDCIRERQLLLGQEEVSGETAMAEVQFYRVDSGSDGQKSVKPHSLNQYVKPSGYLRLQVLVSAVEDKPAFSVFCEDREFSSLEYGQDLYRQVAAHIVGLRRSGEAYPIYITDMDLAPNLLNESGNQVQTVRFLEYKKMIEERLLAELQ
ncbi:class I adenylate cyclase [Thiohalophilus sp.]|uniref:class I adenylate cyclase n=1 Tax=Thiohalophilus sp. TaxID=3028392 RepID=UPI003976801E